MRGVEVLLVQIIYILIRNLVRCLNQVAQFSARMNPNFSYFRRSSPDSLHRKCRGRTSPSNFASAFSKPFVVPSSRTSSPSQTQSRMTSTKYSSRNTNPSRSSAEKTAKKFGYQTNGPPAPTPSNPSYPPLPHVENSTI